MSIETTLDRIKSLEKDANENVETGPIETLAGRRGRKTQAIEQLKVLRREYTTQLLKSAIFILVTGSQRKEFEQIGVTPAFDFFANDPDTFYKDLANRVHPTLYQGKASPSNLFDVLGRHLEDKMNELDATEYNQIVFREEYVQVINSANDFAALLKKAINEQMGSEIVGIQAIASIADKAIESGYKGHNATVILGTDDESLVLDLVDDLQRLTPRVYLVLAGKTSKQMRGVENAISVKDVNEESFLKTVKQILKTI